MKAQLLIRLSKPVVVPTGAQFVVPTMSTGGYTFTVFPPVRTEIAPTLPFPHVALDGKPAFYADGLRLEVHRDSFDRRVDVWDPPLEILKEVVTELVERLRFATKSFSISPVRFPECDWHLSYRNDDGTDVEESAGLVKGRGVEIHEFGYAVVDGEAWRVAFALPNDFQPPSWHTLLLDAIGALPHIGSAVVLAAVGLETFITETLNALAKRQAVNPELWDWISEPAKPKASVEHRYTTLLKAFVGHSLSEDAQAWASFMDLKNARNTFGHRGVASVKGKAISQAEAATLVTGAFTVVARVREWLPEELRWPEIKPPQHGLLMAREVISESDLAHMATEPPGIHAIRADD
ncbi:hypothetical protein [Lysobacter sp. FW306-1B-D06B]|uniref:hypothetical protein n=1 Tax=Lysobacter sp. FW306-1B-D06B TaxID=3140250 RepID=UPI0031405A01